MEPQLPCSCKSSKRASKRYATSRSTPPRSLALPCSRGLLISPLAVARIREDMTYGNGIAKRALQADLAALTGRGHKVGIARTPSKQSTPLVDEFWGTEHAQASRDHTHASSATLCERCAGSGVVWLLWLQATSCRDSPTCRGPCGSFLGSICIPTSGRRAAGLCPAATAGLCPTATSASGVLVLLRQPTGLLPVCPAVPRRVEAGGPIAAAVGGHRRYSSALCARLSPSEATSALSEACISGGGLMAFAKIRRKTPCLQARDAIMWEEYSCRGHLRSDG